ncbi:MAG: heme-copper oxidase subunit III [Gemmatimonadota bacterium]
MSAPAATLTMERRPEPRPQKQAIPNGVMGMLLFVFTEGMLFAGMISAYVIVKAQAAGQLWPPYGQPRLPVEETAVNTAALLLSGAVLILAQKAFGRERRRAVLPMAVSVLLGMFFVGFQGVEWVHLLGEGLTMVSSTYGAFFYLIVGTHAAHAVGAILAMIWAWNRMRRGSLTQSQFATVQVFWYFVVLVWPVLYWKVYLS